jgi:hypothetical protein
MVCSTNNLASPPVPTSAELSHDDRSCLGVSELYGCLNRESAGGLQDHGSVGMSPYMAPNSP